MYSRYSPLTAGDTGMPLPLYGCACVGISVSIQLLHGRHKRVVGHQVCPDGLLLQSVKSFAVHLRHERQGGADQLCDRQHKRPQGHQIGLEGLLRNVHHIPLQVDAADALIVLCITLQQQQLPFNPLHRGPEWPLPQDMRSSLPPPLPSEAPHDGLVCRRCRQCKVHCPAPCFQTQQWNDGICSRSSPCLHPYKGYWLPHRKPTFQSESAAQLTDVQLLPANCAGKHGKSRTMQLNASWRRPRCVRTVCVRLYLALEASSVLHRLT